MTLENSPLHTENVIKVIQGHSRSFKGHSRSFEGHSAKIMFYTDTEMAEYSKSIRKTHSTRLEGQQGHSRSLKVI